MHVPRKEKQQPVVDRGVTSEVTAFAFFAHISLRLLCINYRLHLDADLLLNGTRLAIFHHKMTLTF